MGLGKTMQAITAIRLLLRRGEVRSVLLVCPKPLVTNWQREFRPLGPRDAADGHGRRPGAAGLAVAIGRRPDADRQLRSLCRDRDVERWARRRPHAFDLVVLDESQRIKNRASNTSQVVRSIARAAVGP